MKSCKQKFIKGISVCNPVDISRDYLMFTVEYARANHFNHLQIIGPIHDYTKGNIDGMTLYRKYKFFNQEKNPEYISICGEVINEACGKAKSYGIKTYMWHHELFLPSGFKEKYPQTLNGFGDIEVSHQIVKDFLENKIYDFFCAYPDMDGIILTLHETSIPLLKLKNQKLSKIERVKYVTEILYKTCASLGKELIVRPFASIDKDYAMMAAAYEEISGDLVIMDKWTQFDWSLTMPGNPFFNKIKNNPLFVEADIFGEFFGKGRLPLLLDKHIKNKFEYCNKFNPCGYVARIDRNGQDPFGDVNEVNLEIMNACLSGADADAVTDNFFKLKYPGAASEVKSLMQKTEEILVKTIYIKGYLFSQLSIFPDLNHCKNHYYFEMMRSDCYIDSNEFYIPKNWQNPTRETILKEKTEAMNASKELYNTLISIKDKIEKSEYKKLWVKFCNLSIVTEMWYLLTLAHICYVRYFESRDKQFSDDLEKVLNKMAELNRKGKLLLHEKFYCTNGDNGSFDYVNSFIVELRKSFILEKHAVSLAENEDDTLDYIVCGGGMEGHRLQKEVNFSDTLILEDGICRIAGSKRGRAWSTVNSHGWFSYCVNVKPYCNNILKIELGSLTDTLDIDILIDNNSYTISEKIKGKKEFTFVYNNNADKAYIRLRFDRRSANTPCVYTIKTYAGN